MLQTAAKVMSDLIDRFVYTRSTTDLDALIDMAAAVAGSGPALPPARLNVLVSALARARHHGASMEMASLASDLHSQSERDADADALEAALVLAIVAARISDPATDQGMFTAVLLGGCLSSDFEKSHRLGSLFESVVVLRDVFEAAPVGSVVWIGAATELAMALKQVAEFHAEFISLHEAAAVYELLLRKVPEFAEIAAIHHNYGELLTLKYSQIDDATILGNAIEQRQSAVEKSADDHPYLMVRRAGLAEALLNRFAVSETADDLDRAIEVLTASPPTATMLSPRIEPPVLYASYLVLRYEYWRVVEDLRIASALSADSSASLEGQPDRIVAGRLCLEGAICLQRWEAAPTNANAMQAFGLFREALRRDSSKVAAARWGIQAAAAAMSKPPDEVVTFLAEQAERFDRTGLRSRWVADPLTIALKRMFGRLDQGGHD